MKKVDRKEYWEVRNTAKREVAKEQAYSETHVRLEKRTCIDWLVRD